MLDRSTSLRADLAQKRLYLAYSKCIALFDPCVFHILLPQLKTRGAVVLLVRGTKLSCKVAIAFVMLMLL